MTQTRTDAAIIVDRITRQFIVRRNSGGSGWLRRTKTTETFTAVQDLSFTIPPGEKVGFIGPNGAGKSTTLKMLCGLLKPDAGGVSVCGLVPWRETQELSRHIGLVFGQRSHLWPALPVHDSFDLLAKIYDLDAAVYKKQKSRLVEAFGLSDFLGQSARTLSLGQRMRCDLAAALLHQPSVLFLDEPTIGLDITAKAALRDHLNTLARDFETTVLLTSHDTDDIERICERVIIIDHGRKVLDTGLTDLRRDYARYKTLTLATEEEHPDYAHDHVTVIERSPHRLVLSVDVSLLPLEKIMGDCLARFSLRDISIENMPMEDMIHAIYQAGGVS